MKRKGRGDKAPESVSDSSGDSATTSEFFDGLPAEDERLFEDLEATPPLTEQYDDLAEAVRSADADGPVDQTLSVHIGGGVGLGVVGFEDMADGQDEAGVKASIVEDDEQTAKIKAEIEAASQRRVNLQRRVATGLVLMGVTGLAVWAGSVWFVAFVGMVMFLAVGEFYGASRRAGFTPMALLGLVATILLYIFGWKFGAFGIASTVGFSIVILLLYYAVVPRQRPFENMTITALGFIWIAAMGAFAVPLVAATAWQQLLGLIVLTVTAGDTGALLIGRWLGRTRFAPAVSPNKTVEGLIGGTALAFVAAVGLSSAPWFSSVVTLEIALWTAGAVSFISPIGDLVESMVKRSIGVKDMGTILPGHGGVLDRVDSFLLVMPVMYAVYFWLGLLG